MMDQPNYHTLSAGHVPNLMVNLAEEIAELMMVPAVAPVRVTVNVSSCSGVVSGRIWISKVVKDWPSLNEIDPLVGVTS